jgi:pyruvate/2-oxoglutarate/acetoin dehydrogenase E1 component
VSYIETINRFIRAEVLARDNVVIYGQNISAGSCLGGLTRGLSVKKSSRIINTPNSENTLIGLGFGLLMNNISSIYFAKQLDFMLLGIDQIVNTNNYIRTKQLTASFTIFPVIVDSGYQGIQSSYNALGDICSMGHIPGFAINGIGDGKRIIEQEAFRPGIKIIGVGQRLFQRSVSADLPIMWAGRNNAIYEYAKGSDVTIVCFNLALSYGLDTMNMLKERGYAASLYNVNYVFPPEWSRITADVTRTGRLLIIDDSKSMCSLSDSLKVEVLKNCEVRSLESIVRPPLEESLRPCPDHLIVPSDQLVEKLFGNHPVKHARIA